MTKSLINPLISTVISLIGLFLNLITTSIKNLILQNHLTQTIIEKNLTFTFMLINLTQIRQLGTSQIRTLSFIAEHSNVAEFPSVEKVNQFVIFCTIIDKHDSHVCAKLEITTPLHGLSQ